MGAKIALSSRVLFSGSALVALIATTSSAIAAGCTIERAVYKPAGGFGQNEVAQYELVHAAKRIESNQSNLVAIIRHSGLKRAHEFGFAFSNGYGRTHLLYSGTDKYAKGDADGARDEDASVPGSPIMYFDARMRVVETPVKAGGPAPQYLIMPEIGLKFWYGGKDDRKFVPPDGLWKLSACRK
jgi:hypothetical protein